MFDLTNSTVVTLACKDPIFTSARFSSPGAQFCSRVSEGSCFRFSSLKSVCHSSSVSMQVFVSFMHFLLTGWLVNKQNIIKWGTFLVVVHAGLSHKYLGSSGRHHL